MPKPPAAEDDLFDLADEPEAPAASPIAPPPWPSAIPKPPSAATPPPREPVAASQQAPQPLVGPIQRNSVAARRPLLSGRRYLLFGLALAPLVFMMFLDENDIKVRRESTYQNHPEVVDKFVSLLKTAHDKPFSEKDILRVLPDQRIEGALLSCDSFAHWGYGLLSAAFFAGMLWTLFPRGNADPGRTALVALGTATFGIVFLLALQGIANATDGYMLTGGSIIVLIFYLLKFISFSYHAALDSNNGFLVSFFGYTFGVGLCEEFCKAYPLVFRLGFKPPLDCRGACFWGLASGVGFGVAEGIMYSSIHYNGVSTATIYLVRFTACVALHATWSASAAIMIWGDREFFASQWQWSEMALHLLLVLAAPMVLHGLYDTFLKKEMIGFAVPVALASFAWLAFLIETVVARYDRVGEARYAV